MKPAPFLYHAPETIDEALALLQEHGSDAKVLAGGQSLIPTMNFRLAQPAVLVDLNRIEALDYVETDADGRLRLGAMRRQGQVEIDPLVRERAPLVAQAMPYIAHPQIRSRGTFGGSMAHADPASELPAVAVTLGASFRVRGPEGEREIGAEDFFLGLFTTVIEPHELLIEVVLPPLADNTGVAFEEVSRRHGDYALAGVAVMLGVDAQGNCSDLRIGMLSVGDGPVLAEQGSAALIGQRPTDAAIGEVAALTAEADIDPPADIHASSAYRRHLARVLVGRAVRRARDDALARRASRG